MENSIPRFFDALAGSWDLHETHTQSEIYEFLKEHAGLERGMRVLDLGCGTGIISESLYRITGQKVTAVDVSPKMIETAKSTRNPNSADFLVRDFYDFEHEPFDAIVCFNAYPHFSNISEFVSKARTLLVAGGTLTILHNMSRGDLNKHHAGISSDVSRNLEQIDAEARPFLDFFDLDYAVDNDKTFALRLKRKL